jgi:hypothetical protein
VCVNKYQQATRLTGKDAQPLQSVKTVITAVLTVMSGLKNSQNKWLLDLWLTYDDEILMLIKFSS